MRFLKNSGMLIVAVVATYIAYPHIQPHVSKLLAKFMGKSDAPAA